MFKVRFFIPVAVLMILVVLMMGIVTATMASPAPSAVAAGTPAPEQASALARFDSVQPGAVRDSNLVETVRHATVRYLAVDEATKAGYGLFHGCVSGPQEGAMGIHYVNGDLVGDGALDPERPEALLYQTVNGKMRLTGVEYVVIAEAWDAANAAPPTLMGQLFNYVGSPNRYGIPAFYELHVWAWEQNPLGTFADWNPKVTCEGYTAESSHGPASH